MDLQVQPCVSAQGRKIIIEEKFSQKIIRLQLAGALSGVLRRYNYPKF
jgi:hypothetical protein